MKYYRAILFLICPLLLQGCGFLAYQPDSQMYTQPEAFRNRPTQFELKGPGGRVIVWKFSGGGKKTTKIIQFHGNAQNISSHFYSLYWLPDHGYDYYIFDYPGYGGSEGEPTQETVALTSQFVVDWVISENPASKIAIVGQSLGGNVAAYTTSKTRQKYADKNPVCLLTLDSTFKSYRTVARTLLSNHAVTWPFQWLGWLLVSDSYSAKSELPLVSPVPSLVIHGNKDRIVNYSNGQDVFEALNEPKEFVRVENGDHIDAFVRSDREIYQKKFLEQLSKYCD